MHFHNIKYNLRLFFIIYVYNLHIKKSYLKIIFCDIKYNFIFVFNMYGYNIYI